MKTITQAEISKLREAYYLERNTKPVGVCPYLDIDTSALEKYEPIRVEFAGCGAWHNFYAVRIVGGPDDGKVADTYPWHPAEYLEYGATVYNGPRDEYDRTLGYPARPLIRGCTSGLHAATVAYLTGMLSEMRDQSMSDHITHLYDRLPKPENL